MAWEIVTAVGSLGIRGADDPKNYGWDRAAVCSRIETLPMPAILQASPANPIESRTVPVTKKTPANRARAEARLMDQIAALNLTCAKFLATVEELERCYENSVRSARRSQTEKNESKRSR
jgi:hypothetical protein